MRPALIALALIAPALAAMPAMSQAPAKPASGSYSIDSAHSQVLFTVTHFGVSEYTGQFTSPTGTLVLDTANAANDKVDVTFPIAKVSTTVGALDEHLKKADFFDADKFPEGRFVSTSVKATGNGAVITGNLTLKGVTRPVTLQARFVGAGDNPMSKKLNIGFAATGTVKRSDFGISYGIPMVSDAVKLTINAAFQAQ